MHDKLHSARKRLQHVYQSLSEIVLAIYFCRKIIAVLIWILLLVQGMPAELEQLYYSWVEVI